MLIRNSMHERLSRTWRSPRRAGAAAIYRAWHYRGIYLASDGVKPEDLRSFSFFRLLHVVLFPVPALRES